MDRGFAWSEITTLFHFSGTSGSQVAGVCEKKSIFVYVSGCSTEYYQ